MQKDGSSVENETYNAMKKELWKTIKNNKRRSWKTLCEEVNEDTGLGYQIVMRKIGKHRPADAKKPETMEEIVIVRGRVTSLEGPRRLVNATQPTDGG